MNPLETQKGEPLKEKRRVEYTADTSMDKFISLSSEAVGLYRAVTQPDHTRWKKEKKNYDCVFLSVEETVRLPSVQCQEHCSCRYSATKGFTNAWDTWTWSCSFILSTTYVYVQSEIMTTWKTCEGPLPDRTKRRSWCSASTINPCVSSNDRKLNWGFVLIESK